MNIWTQEQSAVFKASEKGGNIIISAAAGSGKTAVLTEIIARLIKNGVPLDEIAVATFTKKAAAEIKERVQKAAPQSPLIQSEIEGAEISTVHSLCLNAIKENPALYGLKPGFGTLDEADLALLRRDTLDEVTEGIALPDVTAIAELIGGADALREALLSCLSHAERSRDILTYLKRQSRLYSEPALFQNEICQSVKYIIRAFADRALETCREMIQSAKADTTAAVIESDICKLEQFNKYDLSVTDAPAVSEMLNTLSLSRWSAKGEDKETAEILKKTRDNYVKSDITNITKLLKTLPSFADSVAGLSPKIHTFINLCTKFIRTYEQKKRALNAIEFSDMEKLFLKAKKTNKSYTYIIGDEFQDSNETQYDIFSKLTREGSAKIFVGDIKQSIYGFRKADPRVFGRVQNDPAFRQYSLTRNFRSNKHIIDTCNRIFAPLMPRYEPLRHNPEQPAPPNTHSYVTELVLCEKNGECEYISNRILQLIDSKFQVNDKGEFRPCTFGDFAILTRKGESHFKPFTELFTEKGIPVAVQGMSNYLNLQSVETAVSFLNVITNPYDDFSLLAVLLRLYGFTPDDLANIKQRRKPLFTCINYRKDIPRVQNFLASYRCRRQSAENDTVSAFVRRVMDEGVFLPLLSERGGEENLRQLILYAEKFDATPNCGGIAEFTRQLRRVKSEGARMREAITQNEINAVKLMTIHSSKGLEFPVVFIAKTTKRLGSAKSDNRVSAAHRVSFGEQYLAADLINKRGRFVTTTSLVNKFTAELSEYEEEKRVLYVAATRARDKLIFTGESADTNIRNTFYKMLEPALAPTTAEVAENTDIQQRVNVSVREHSADEQITLRIPPEKKQIPTKLTATSVGVDKAITFENTDEPSVFPRMPAFARGENKQKLTGKKRGDAYHKAMELLNFADFADVTPQNISREITVALAAIAHAFAPVEFAAINPAHIAGFFTSPLGRRAAAAATRGKVVKEFKLCTEMTAEETAAQFGLADFKPFIQGIADLFFYEADENGGDKIVVADYKTNNNTTAEKLTAEYGGQLRIYKRALEEMTGCGVKACYLYSFFLNREILLEV